MCSYYSGDGRFSQFCTSRLELGASEIARYQTVLHNAFAHIQSTELKEMFVAELTRFLDAQSASQKPIKVTLKILGIFTSNILNLLQDKELPERIKHLVIQKMPESTKILEKMYRRDPRTLLHKICVEKIRLGVTRKPARY
jgi:hypothetical protein